MRGVSGYALDLLRAKAAGQTIMNEDDSPEHQMFLDLLERGLLAPGVMVKIGNHRHWNTSITPLGRIVLAASEAK